MSSSLSIQRLELLLRQLGNLSDELVFVGGAVIELYLDRLPEQPIRPTKDVDCIVSTASRSQYQKIEEQLYKRGFSNAGFTEANSPICRYKFADLILDVMPSDEAALGFTNRWFKFALQAPIDASLPSGQKIRLPSWACFFAIKLEAMIGRGGDDLRSSQDLEDIIVLLDGATNSVEQIGQAPEAVRSFVIETIRQLLHSADFRECVEACAPAGFTQAERILAQLYIISKR